VDELALSSMGTSPQTAFTIQIREDQQPLQWEAEHRSPQARLGVLLNGTRHAHFGNRIKVILEYVTDRYTTTLTL
jgi:hypothetical protein